MKVTDDNGERVYLMYKDDFKMMAAMIDAVIACPGDEMRSIIEEYKREGANDKAYFLEDLLEALTPVLH